VKMPYRKKAAALGVAALSASLLAACSSSSSGSSAPATNGPSSGSAVASGAAAAAAFVKPYLSAPAGVGITTPLRSVPPKGKRIVVLANETPAGALFYQPLRAASATLGWTVTNVPIGSTPSSIAAAFQSALALHPSAIEAESLAPATLTTELQQAKAQGVPVGFSGGGASIATGGVGDVDGVQMIQLELKVDIANIVAQSNGTAHILLVDVPAASGDFTTADSYFKSTVASYCQGCKVTVLDEQLSDIGTQLPNDVVGVIQKDPSINYLAFTFGDMSIGVVPALKAAGLSDVKVTGILPDSQNAADLKSGLEDAWVGSATTIVAWGAVDSFARKFEGMPTDVDQNWQQPIQLLTKDNISSAAFANNYYLGLPTYAQSFERLWKVSS